MYTITVSDINKENLVAKKDLEKRIGFLDMYYVYMLRCIDNSLYTGITTDLNRRMKEHFEKTDRCAKYTRYHSAYKLETAWKTNTKALASKLEYHIKKDLNKVQKEKLLKNPENINLFFDRKIDCDEFEVVKIGQENRPFVQENRPFVHSIWENEQVWRN